MKDEKLKPAFKLEFQEDLNEELDEYFKKGKGKEEPKTSDA